MQETSLTALDEAAVSLIAELLGAAIELAPYRVRGQPVYQLAVPNQTLGQDLVIILWPALNRVDVRIGDCAMVFKTISRIEIFPGVEVMFRRTDPPGHLFISVNGRAEMVV
ncbi:MAG: hypothetical protein ACR2PL_11590 [Dehalococcoidia bacterium]